MAKSVVSDLDFGGVARPTGLPAPVSSSDAANKGYVDSAVEGLAWKASARVATQANVNLASPGAAVDGVAMAANDRVLVRSQTAPAENGIYIWNGAAVAMTRSADASTAAELEQAVVSVEEGTSAGASYRQTSINFVLDTGAVAWAAFGTAAGAASETSAGVAEIATQAETDAGADDARIVTPAKLANHANRAKRYSTDVGDGAATQYTVTHNLGTRDVLVQVRRNSGNYDEVMAQVEVLTTNTVRVTFATAPTANQFRVSVLA